MIENQNDQVKFPEGSNKLSASRQIEDWIFEQGGACLWQREFNQHENVERHFSLSCFGLRGRVFILQTWPNGGCEVYGTIGDPTIEGTIAEVKALAFGVEPTLAGRVDGALASLVLQTSDALANTWNGCLENARRKVKEVFIHTRYQRS
jgi:hypothetical protein